MKNFALIGAAGFVAPRHMKAIKDTNNRLVAALDKNDSVGVIDSYFPDADFFTEFERFDRHIDKLRRLEDERRIDFTSIASPNYLHDAHIRFSLREGADAICEKPVVLNPWNVEALQKLERETKRRVYAILQLRHHPAIEALKKKVDEGRSKKRYSVDLSYISGRGRWYFYSWKGDEAKSGGIATNIGVHFFDMLIWIFGKARSSVLHVKAPDRCSGCLELERADVRWFLSINFADVPEETRRSGKSTFRCVTIDGAPLEFSAGFADLHTVSYQKILSGQGFGLKDSYEAIDAVYNIRHLEPNLKRGDIHPLARAIIRK